MPLLVNCIPISHALDVQVSGSSFSINIEQGNTTKYQLFPSLNPSMFVCMTVHSGTWNATNGNLIIYSDGSGYLSFLTISTFSLQLSTQGCGVTFNVYGSALSGGYYQIFSGSPINIYWTKPTQTTKIVKDEVFATTTTKYTALKDFYCSTYSGNGTNSLMFLFINDAYFGTSWINPATLVSRNYFKAETIWVITKGDLFVKTFYSFKSSSSGYLYCIGADTSYEAVNNNPLATTIFEDPLFYVIGQRKYTGYYDIFRTFLYFDTSLLLKGVEIINVTLYIYSTDYITFSHTISLVVQNGQPNYPHSSLQKSDYFKNLYSGNYGELSSDDYVTDQYNAIQLNNSIINPNGLTKICLRTNEDIQGITPTALDEIFLMMNGTDKTAYLKVWYSADAEIIVHTNNIETGLYVNNAFTGCYFSEGNNYTIIFPLSPNNATSNPHYTISVSPVAGYLIPKPSVITLKYGDIWEGTFIYLVPESVILNPEIFDLGTGLMFIGIFAVIGYAVCNSIFDKWGGYGSLAGGVCGMILSTHFGFTPMLWLWLVVLAVSIGIYIKFKHSFSGGR